MKAAIFLIAISLATIAVVRALPTKHEARSTVVGIVGAASTAGVVLR